MYVPVTLPVLFRKTDEGNSACIRQVRPNGRASENWIFNRKCPVLIEGVKKVEEQ